MVYGQRNCKSDGPETRVSKHRTRTLGFSQEGARLRIGERYSSLTKVYPREIKSGSRPDIQTGRDLLVVAEGPGKVDQESRPLQLRTIWSLRGAGGSSREGRLDGEEDLTLAATRESQGGNRFVKQAKMGDIATGASDIMGEDSSNSNPCMARSVLVGRAEKTSKRATGARKVASSRAREMGGEQWKKEWLDSVMDGFAFQKLADTSKQQYQRRVCKYLDWVWEEKREGGTLVDNIRTYLEELAKTKSGVNVYATKSILVAMFREELEEREVAELDRCNQILVREANERNPTRRHPAEAISFVELKQLVDRAAQLRLSREEEVSLEVFIIAFCTMSRVGEIARIGIEDILDNGEAIKIRPKTEGATGKTVIKCVRGAERLVPAEILRKRQKEAMKNGRNRVFTRSEKKDVGLLTSSITKTLMALAERCKMGRHITSHSARKGAATEAVLAGVPLVVVKAMGYWTQLDTLEKYIGDTIRQQVALETDRFNFLNRVK